MIPADGGQPRKWQERLRPRTNGNSSLVQLVIEAGGNLRAKNNEGLTPLMFAMQKGEKNRENILSLILYSKPEEINERDHEGGCALHHLAKVQNAKTAFLEEITKVSVSIYNEDSQMIFNFRL